MDSSVVDVENSSETIGGGIVSPSPQTTVNTLLPVNPTSIHPFGNPLSTVLTVKLDDKNYILWRKMVLVLKGQKLNGYILGD